MEKELTATDKAPAVIYSKASSSSMCTGGKTADGCESGD